MYLYINYLLIIFLFLIEGVVNNSGDNLSNGQKQLLCLARAILQDNVCLIMDEPTSSVDDETEKKLLEAIKKSFNGRTVITIAVITIYISSVILLNYSYDVLTYHYIFL